MGIINQRYMIVLKGNANELEVSSNFERFKRVRSLPDQGPALVFAQDAGGGQCRRHRRRARQGLGKENSRNPPSWTIKAETSIVHKQGSPGLFGFTPQNQMRVYIDNVKVTPNK